MAKGPVEWRPIPGFARYEASSDGRVRVVRTGQIRLPYDTGERLVINLVRDDGVAPTPAVGALILRAFVGPPPDGCEVSHQNGDYRDNRPENLAWETHAENMARKWEHGTVLQGDRHGKTKLTDAQVLEVVTRLANGEPGLSLAIEYGVSPQTISGYKYGSRVVTRH